MIVLVVKTGKVGGIENQGRTGGSQKVLLTELMFPAGVLCFVITMLRLHRDVDIYTAALTGPTPADFNTKHDLTHNLVQL